MAQFLEEHPKVWIFFLLFVVQAAEYQPYVFVLLTENSISWSQIARVYYPGLPSHPEHHITKTQMTGFGGVVSFEVIYYC